jgi:uncharacterized protein YecE (DUF72 family)
VRLRVGCSGWSYPEWVGPFYPAGTRNDQFLRLYAKVFDTVEVDSTFYGVPSKETVARWRGDVQDGFTFCPKVPQDVTGGRRDGRESQKAGRVMAPSEVFDEFLEAMDGLGPCLGPLVFQYPASYARSGHGEELARVFARIGRRRAAFEFRHPSWFSSATFSALKEHNAALVWSEVRAVEVPAEATADFLLVRFIGDRSFDPEGKVAHPKDEAIGTWAARIETRAEQVDETFVFFNNHFEGFGPGSANRFLAKAGAPPVAWKAEPRKEASPQKRLVDF